MIDLHCHVLPGIDDGPRTIEGTLALARAAAAAGTDTLVATPHVSWRYPNDSERIAGVLSAVRASLAAEAIALQLAPGAEVAMTRLAEIEPPELQRLGLGGGPWLLLEPPFATIVSGLQGIVRDLHGRGHRVLLAHPERCQAFHRQPQLLRSLVDEGVLASITAGSLVGRFGGHVQRFALELAREQLVHNVASDAHDHVKRAPGMASELQRAGLGQLADWLTREVPAAILADEPIPPRPAVNANRLGRPRRRGLAALFGRAG